jgi:hypothetical protein
MHHHVRVRRAGRGLCDDEYSSTHTQVHHEDCAGVEVAQQVLAAATSRRDARTAQTVDDRFAALAPHAPLAEHLDALDDPANCAALDASANRLYFR